MRLSVQAVIYFYIFICIVLLMFNLLYIFRSGSTKRRQKRKIQLWEKYLQGFAGGTPMWSTAQAFRRLKSVQELMAFYTAMESLEQAEPGLAAAFLRENDAMFLELAKEYEGKSAMEQAFFAYVTAAFYPPVGEGRSPLLEQLLNYLEGSTVYSRENVLNALYALGNTQSVEHAFILMSQRGWYHDPRLLSDGMDRFQGDKYALAHRLWGCRKQLSECFQVGTIRFADALEGDDFAEDFLKALESEPLPTETQFTLVRYFRRHAVPNAKPMLLRMLKGTTDGNRELAIAAAASLVSYPGSETSQALKEALHNPNWYVRQNAARSLKTLGITWEEARAGFLDDRYAAEMLEYILGAHPAAPETGEESEALAAV